MKKVTSLVSWFVHAIIPMLFMATAFPSYSAADTVQSDESNLRVPSWLVASFHHENSASFYGTALLLHLAASANDSHLFVTNAHVLPPPEHRAGLRLASPLWNYELRPVEIVGAAPGFDLAVVRVKKEAESIPEVAIHDLLTFGTIGTPLAQGEYQMALLGVPGAAAFSSELKPGLATLVWRASVLTAPATLNISIPAPLTIRSDCPAPLLLRCYQVPFASRGFSGGALLVRTKHPVTQRVGDYVAGMISHFAPLSSRVFVIPWDIVVNVAKMIEARAAALGDGVIIDSLPNEPSEPVLASSKSGFLEVMRGPHTGAVVTEASVPLVSGGSEHMGGGNSGIASMEMEGFIKRGPYVLGFLGHFMDLQRLLQQPETWRDPDTALASFLSWSAPLRGSQAFLSHEPWVVVEQGMRQFKVYKVDSIPVPSLGAFAAALQSHPAAILSESFARRSLPLPLRLKAGEMGSMNPTLVQRFRSPEDLGNVIHNGTLTLNDTGFAIEDIRDLITRHSAANGQIDMMIAKGSYVPSYALTDAEVNMVGHKVEVRSHTNYGEGITMEFDLEKFQQEGVDAFRFEGEVSIREAVGATEKAWIIKDQMPLRGGHAVATLARDLVSQVWELKMLVAGESAPLPRGIGFLTDEGISLFGIALPLE